MTKEMKGEIQALVTQATIAYVTGITQEGYPSTKAMLSLQQDGLFTHYFSTNLSARHSREFQKNPRACIYFCNEPGFRGLRLEGEIQVHTDREHKAMLWREGFTMYYLDGIDTEDYCVFQFTAYKANYYHGLHNFDFTEEEYQHADL